MDALILQIFYAIGAAAGITACALTVVVGIALCLQWAWWCFKQFDAWQDILKMAIKYRRQKHNNRT